MNYRITPLALSGLLWLAWVCPARGGFTFSFDQSNYTASAGGKVDLKVYLAQTGPTTTLADDGLFTGAVRVFFNGPPPTAPASVLSTADIRGNPSFDGTSSPTLDVNPGVSAGLSEFVDFASPAVKPDPATPDRILLGTFSFTAGDVAGEVTRIRATRYDPSGQNTLTGAGVLLDESAFADGNANITVAGGVAAPAPGGLVLLFSGGLSVIGAGLWRRSGSRRR